MKSSALCVIPVIHHVETGLTLEQAGLAFELGADGVFLISHHDDDASLIPLAKQIRHDRPRAWLGINFLSMGLPAAFRLVIDSDVRIDGLWSDRPGVSSQGYETEALHLATYRALLDDAGRPAPTIFASVAFKYQPLEHDPGLAAAKALELGFVPTTSGSGTGSAPSLSKIEDIRRAIGPEAPLACASGMTLENIATFAPLLSHALVATGVSRDEHHFDAQRLEAFIHMARAASGRRASLTEAV
ncbi:conserved hypothetical protein [Hyphomicrobiales bacterium]|jgi:predicted TIM-barrel enzyme|nr:conserved hypothetical protein [Hyphomicrobiales bacterium]CAH1702852.1 conserved hypothetical protein [Hyphomicrobiales bacterium]CAI0347039.1 conserved hypothetical protein [Hyphomicrobiales bacterium]